MADPVRLAIVDDYADRVLVADLAANEPVSTPVDIALFDTFAQGEADSPDLDVVLANPLAGRVVVYTWVFDQRVIEAALRKGVGGYLSKTLPASQLVAALERIHAGEITVSPTASKVVASGQDWPGRSEGLTARESEILSMIAQGKSNAEIAAGTYLSPNSIKTYVRNAYAKIGVKSRTQAVLWGVKHGLHVEHRRIDDWRLR